MGIYPIKREPARKKGDVETPPVHTKTTQREKVVWQSLSLMEPVLRQSDITFIEVSQVPVFGKYIFMSTAEPELRIEVAIPLTDPV
jgi:hypothetical protein